MDRFSTKIMERLFLTLCYNEEIELTKLSFQTDIMEVDDFITKPVKVGVRPSLDVSKIVDMVSHQSKTEAATK